MRKTDINQYTGAPIKTQNPTALMDDKVAGKLTKKALKTLLAIFLTTMVIVGITTIALITVSSDAIDIDLRDLKLNLTSTIYVNDENGQPQEYQDVDASQKRIWVDYDQIPQEMKDAIVAIEDKRFYEHHGVDWKRTLGATANYVTGGDSYGGSTITQQLIKNLTDKNEVSISRKLGEIINALVLEKNYSKDEILEAYLNVVNFGSGCNGVEAAAEEYFGKSISECDTAECASIAGITQNPTAYNPLLHPEANKERQQTVLKQMYEQNMITEDEYNSAMTESENMQFIEESDDENSTMKINNWYIENMLTDITEDLSEKYNIDEDTAQYMLMNGGYKIYSAMDTEAQTAAEKVIEQNSTGSLPSDPDIEVGYTMMGYDGRVLAIVGQRGEKEGNYLWDRATIATRQPGSSIKPISVYAPALENNYICYSSKIKDEPISEVTYDDGTAWPKNWYNYYKGSMLVPKALEISSNAVAAQVLDMLSLQKSFDFLTQKVGITNLSSDVDMTYSGLATGGGYNGITVEDMTAAYQIFGNNGTYYEPYTYYYVEDSEGNVILDNRNEEGTYAINSTNASIMRYLLYNPIEGSEGTATAAKMSGWKVYGKTGTTDDDANSWFIGGTPYAIAGIWTGYDNPQTITDTAAAIRIWKSIMSQYLSDKTTKSFVDDPALQTLSYNSYSGLLSSGGLTGYYAQGNKPGEQATSNSPSSILNGKGGVTSASSVYSSSQHSNNYNSYNSSSHDYDSNIEDDSSEAPSRQESSAPIPSSSEIPSSSSSSSSN